MSTVLWYNHAMLFCSMMQGLAAWLGAKVGRVRRLDLALDKYTLHCLSCLYVSLLNVAVISSFTFVTSSIFSDFARPQNVSAFFCYVAVSFLCRSVVLCYGVCLFPSFIFPSCANTCSLCSGMWLYLLHMHIYYKYVTYIIKQPSHS
jgi:phosphatidylglycerophosphate synthase